MARHQAAEREKSVSVLASLLPFLSVLYSEFIFAYFAHMPITPVKVWMALGLGGIALALSRTTPLKGAELSAFNRVDDVPLGLYVRAVFIPADVQRLHGTEGRYKRTGIFSRACADHRAELAFFAFDDCGAGAAFYTDAQPFKETRECTGQAYGCKLDGPARRVAAFCNPDFRGRCARSARHGGEPSDRQLLMNAL